MDDDEITTAQQALDDQSRIAEHKQSGGTDCLEVVGVNIAFCPRGLRKVRKEEPVSISIVESPLTWIFQIGKTGNTADGPVCGGDEFSWGMYKERDATGQDDLSQWMQEFHNPGDPWAQHPPDERLHDGLLIVSGDSEGIVSDKLDEILNTFGSSVEETLSIDGKVRPGDNRGREQYVTTHPL